MILNGRQLLLHRSKDAFWYYFKRIGNRWPENIWKNALLANYFARSSLLLRKSPPHKHLPVDKNILTAGWKFCSDGKYFIRSIADEAKMRAKNMAEMFNYKSITFRMPHSIF
jgi:hemoglobin